MAKITELGNQTDLKWIFNVSYAVGPKCPNHRDDIILVQYALNELLAYLDFIGADGKRITAYLRPDGICGTKTCAAIRAYQENLKTRRRVVWIDGIVDSSDATGWTRHSGDQYTIVHLNRDHVQFRGAMMREREFPPELSSAIQRNSPNLYQA